MRRAVICKERTKASICRNLLAFLVVLLLPLQMNGQSTVTRLEYWIDNDYAAKVMLPVSPVAAENFETGIDMSSLPDGLHAINFRFMDELKKWSVVSRKQFIKFTPVEATATFKSAEMWIDERPATGFTRAVSATGVLKLSDLADLSSYPDGVHRLSFRAKDGSGRWSVLISRMFLKKTITTGKSEITKYQYWIDDNTSVLDEPAISANSIRNLDTKLDMSGVADGTHYLYVRFLDESGRWSVPLITGFEKTVVTGTGDVKSNLQFKIWPSPLNGNDLNVILDRETANGAEIHVMDLTGKVLLTHPVTENKGELIRLDMSHIGNGTYIIVYKSGERVVTQKVIIMR